MNKNPWFHKYLPLIPALAFAMSGLILFAPAPATAATPTVNGLFYGDGDHALYSLVNTSYYGSHLYAYYDAPTTMLYVAMVVEPSVNDNVFTRRPPDSAAYMQSVGWGAGGGQQRSAAALTNSEFGAFKFACSLNSPNSWEWGQAYGCEPTPSTGLWTSNATCGPSWGTAPPSYVAASSFVWNINNYRTKYGTTAPPAGSPPWNMYIYGTTSNDWKSPFASSNPNVVPGDWSGYSTTYEWEWSMVYEWSINLATAGCGGNALYILAGLSHHSPMKAGVEGLWDDDCGEENDCFPPPPDGGDPVALADWGDLPDSYGTTLAHDGARHELRITSPYLGEAIQFETNGQPSIDALGDGDEEDGIEFVAGQAWQAGANVGITAIVSGADGGNRGYLVGWFDWNGDGSFSVDERVLFGYMSDGANALSVLIPADANPGDRVYMRFRLYDYELQSVSDPQPTGLAIGGEVEDYVKEFSITHITLSSFRAFTINGQVVVEWRTDSEVGTLGFYLERLEATEGSFLPLTEELLPGLLTSPEGGTYQYVDASAAPGGTYTYRLVEIEAKGKKRIYGPFTVTADWSAPQTDPVPIYRFEPHPPSAVQLARAAAAKASRLAARELQRGRSGLVIKIIVTETGLCYLDAAEIARMMVTPIQRVQNLIKNTNLALTNLGRPVAYLAADGNAGIYFYGQEPNSVYTTENVYWLSEKKGIKMGTVAGSGPEPSGGMETFADTIRFEEDRWPLTALFSDPQDDYWAWDYLIGSHAGLGKKNFTLRADGAAADGVAMLAVHLVGGNATTADLDHHVVIHLNGTEIGQGRWDGAVPHTLEMAFDQSLLADGDNTVKVTAIRDAGVSSSFVYINAFDLTYQRHYRAVDNALALRGDDNPVVTVSGFDNPDVWVFDVSEPRLPKRIQAATVDQAGGGFRVSFQPASHQVRYLALTVDRATVIETAFADLASDLKQKSNAADYVIIAPTGFQQAARVLADYRTGRGYATMVVDLEDIYDEFNAGLSSPEAITAFLAYAYHNWRVAPRYVVLAGNGTYDYKDNQGHGGNFVPPLLVGTPHGLFASDNRLADVVGGDGLPEMAVGRLPAVSAAELQSLIAKIMAYENAAGGDWTSRVMMVADNADHAGNFPADSDAVAALLPFAYFADKTYLGVYNVAQARQRIKDGINLGALLVNYIGHGGMTSMADEGLLRTSDVGALINGDRLPIVSALTCGVGRYEVAGSSSLSEMLVIKPNGGAIAVWAPSGFSYNAEALIMNMRFFRTAFVEDEKILGEIVLDVLSDYVARDRMPYMVDIYNLLGDPALRIR